MRSISHCAALFSSLKVFESDVSYSGGRSWPDHKFKWQLAFTESFSVRFISSGQSLHRVTLTESLRVSEKVNEVSDQQYCFSINFCFRELFELFGFRQLPHSIIRSHTMIGLCTGGFTLPKHNLGQPHNCLVETSQYTLLLCCVYVLTTVFMFCSSASRMCLGRGMFAKEIAMEVNQWLAYNITQECFAYSVANIPNSMLERIQGRAEETHHWNAVVILCTHTSMHEQTNQ